MFRLLPKEDKYFEMFNIMAAQITECALLLQKLFSDFDKRAAYAEKIKDVEHNCDLITHDIVKKLNQTFITPIDREDIHALSSALDDVLDLVDTVASRLVTYKVREVTPGARQLAMVVLHGAEIMHKAVSELGKPENILEYCSQLTQLEKQADRIKTECVGRLFEHSGDPIEIIKWKELYEVLEATTDKLEDVADVLESVVVKAA